VEDRFEKPKMQNKQKSNSSVIFPILVLILGLLAAFLVGYLNSENSHLVGSVITGVFAIIASILAWLSHSHKAMNFPDTTPVSLNQREKLIYDEVIENVPVAIFVKDIQNGMRFVVWNKMSEQIYGLKSSEVLGKAAHDLFDREIADFFFKVDRRVAAEQAVVEVPEQVIASKILGKVVLRTIKVPIHGADGKPELLLGISENITSQKMAEQQAILKTEEVEKLNKVLIGREVKMVELQQKLDSLLKNKA
jgi:PAS domain S-box-containing protein